MEEDDQGRIILGDIIVSIDNTPVKSANDLFSILDQHKAGDKIKIGYIRDGKKQETEATLQVTA